MNIFVNFEDTDNCIFRSELGSDFCSCLSLCVWKWVCGQVSYSSDLRSQPPSCLLRALSHVSLLQKTLEGQGSLSLVLLNKRGLVFPIYSRWQWPASGARWPADSPWKTLQCDSELSHFPHCGGHWNHIWSSPYVDAKVLPVTTQKPEGEKILVLLLGSFLTTSKHFKILLSCRL